MHTYGKQSFVKASGGLHIHETVMILKLNYSHPGRDKKKKKKRGRGRPSFQKSDILEVLNMHNSGESQWKLNVVSTSENQVIIITS